MFVGVDHCSRLDGLVNDLTHFILPRFWNCLCANLRLSLLWMSFEQAKHGLLSLTASMAAASILVHESGRAADIGLIDFNWSPIFSQLKSALCDRQTNPVIHKPSGFLRHTQVPCDFA